MELPLIRCLDRLTLTIHNLNANASSFDSVSSKLRDSVRTCALMDSPLRDRKCAAKEEQMSITCIREADWVVAWDADRDCHVYRRRVDVVFDESGILYLGQGYRGPVEVEIEGRERLVIPGLVNLHCHPSAQAIFRGYTEEFGNPRLFFSDRHRFRQSFEVDHDGMLASAHFTVGELLRGGVTTVVDLSHPYEGWLEALAATGVRAVVAPMYRSATWYTDTGQSTLYDWHSDGGAAAFEEAKEVMDAAERHPSGRFSAMVSPAQVDTCTEELLRASAELAHATGRPLHVHASQSYAEFQGMTRLHAVTPINYLRRLGFLGPSTILGHAVFTDEHPWLHWPTRTDLETLSSTGTTVAHAPTVFARDGTLLHDLGHYARAGVRFGIGTDTHPHSMLEELRMAEVLARVAAGPRHDFGTAAVFRAATVGGARALGREDLGRLAPGARADVVLVDLEHPAMEPMRDPLRSLIYSAAERSVTDVFVDGCQVVRDGAVLTVDRRGAARRLREAQQRSGDRVRQIDPQGASVDDLVPWTLPLG